MEERVVDRVGEAVSAALDPFVERGDVAGLAWTVVVGGEECRGAAGVPVDAVFRIASVTKPFVSVLARQLVEEGRIGLDDPLDDVLPELADRRVLRDPRGPIDGPTVPAVRPITLRDLLTFRFGLGMDFDFSAPQPVLDAMDELGVGVGPTAPEVAPDEYLRRLGGLPLAHQPGRRWLYHTGSDVVGVLVERIRGRSLDQVLRDHLLDPLGLVDTGFSVRADQRDRCTVARMGDESGTMSEWDGVDGRWSEPPVFRSGATGLVSTAADVARFGRALLAGGGLDGVQVLSADSVRSMTTNQLAPGQEAAVADAPARVGWGHGVGVHLDGDAGPWTPGTYGWDGGLGSTWRNDPALDLVGVLLTTDSFTSAELPAVCVDFWDAVEASVGSSR
jgi:CubicO group peptidase (beta-lactamase class C family)